jgi:hypothetical protein
MPVFLSILSLGVGVFATAISIANANALLKLVEQKEEETAHRKNRPESGLIDPSTKPYVPDEAVSRQPNYADMIVQNTNSTLDFIKDE